MQKTSSQLWQRVSDEYAPLVFLAALVAVLSISTKGFATGNNMLNVARQHAIIIVLAVGQTMVMIAGGIDLSVGSVLALSGVVTGVLAASHVPTPVCLTLGVLTGCFCGFINGVVTAKARVPAFIATLGMMGMAKGIALVLSGGVGIPLPRSATEWTESGNVMLAYIQVADPTAGEGYELDSIAAAVIGGTSLFGGRGSVGGTVVGAFILAVLRNGCDLRNISEHWQRFVVGLMTIVAVFYDRLRRRS